MNKIFSFVILSILAGHLLFAQNDVQISISTEDGIFTVSKTGDGKDMILFNVGLWDDIMKGTKYVSKNCSTLKPVHACLEIAGKKHMHCDSGIGFRCGIYDCNCYSNSKPVLVNNKNRVCSTLIQKINSQTIRMIFCDKVDWNSLQCKTKYKGNEKYIDIPYLFYLGFDR